MDFNKRLAETMIKAVNNPDYINTEIFKWKHEKEIAKKLTERMAQYVSHILGNIDDILKLNPTKSGLVFPEIREAGCLDISGKPYRDWKGYRKRRREAGLCFPMANYDFRDPAGLNILHDDCEDMLDLLHSRAELIDVGLAIDLLFIRCDMINARFHYLLGCVAEVQKRKKKYKDGPGKMSWELGQVTLDTATKALSSLGGIDGYDDLPRGKKGKVRDEVVRKCKLKDERHTYNIFKELRKKAINKD